MLIVAALSSCATPPDRRVAEADRTWRCEVSRPLPGGWMIASVSVTGAGMQRGAIRFLWRRRVAADGSIEVDWNGTDGAGPSAAARTLFSFRIGPPHAGHRRLELRRAGRDGSLGEIVFSSPFERMPWRVDGHWGDVLAAAHAGAFFAVVTDHRGGIHAQTRVEGDVVAQPSRDAAMLQPQMSATIADYQRRCRPGSERDERVIVL